MELNLNKRFVNLKNKNNHVKKLMVDKTKLEKDIKDVYLDIDILKETTLLLSKAHENNTEVVLKSIEDTINQALYILFPKNSYRIITRRVLYGNRHPQVLVEIEETKPNGEKITLDFQLQSSNGVSQVVSFLYSMRLLEMTGARPIVMLDEALVGIHNTVLPYIQKIIEVYAKEGFQFFMVDYGLYMGDLYKTNTVDGNFTLSKSTLEEIEEFESVAELLEDMED